MWVCQKCKTKSERASRICRACGGIVDEIADDQPRSEEIATSETKAGSASSPEVLRDSPIKAVAEADALEQGERPRPQKAAPHRDWKCLKCGEVNPGNFDVCWKCLTTKAGEQAEDAEQLLAEVDESDQETEAWVDDSEVLTLEADDGELAVPTKCLRCGSTKIIPDVTILDQGQGSTGKLQVVIVGNPEASIFKDHLYGEIKADICGECGHVELRVANPRELYQHYQKSR